MYCTLVYQYISVPAQNSMSISDDEHRAGMIASGSWSILMAIMLCIGYSNGTLTGNVWVFSMIFLAILGLTIIFYPYLKRMAQMRGRYPGYYTV